MRTSSSLALPSFVLVLGLATALTGCGDDDVGTDGGARDSGARDGGADGGTSVDAGGGTDGGVDAGGGTDGGVDAGGATDGSVTDGSVDDGGGVCASDADCTFGAEWCVDGSCVACDDSGTVCDRACDLGWEFPVRNGCTPCTCAPPSRCTSDADCGSGRACFAGAWCWDGCSPAGDPSCCQGNLCAGATCIAPPPVGCRTRGCPTGKECRVDMGCASSACGCDTGIEWTCTADCSGGICVTGDAQ